MSRLLDSRRLLAVNVKVYLRRSDTRTASILAVINVIIAAILVMDSIPRHALVVSPQVRDNSHRPMNANA